jgi:PAS domain S-box-containing protein
MQKQLRILFVEDSEDDEQLIRLELSRAGYKIESERVETAAHMQSALDRNAWDLVICDYSMPRFNAPQALDVLKANGQDLPFIIVSGTITEESAVNSLRKGAHDFLVKTNLARLVPAVERELREAETRRERSRAEEALRMENERFQRFVESNIVGIVIADTTGKITTANDYYLNILGVTRRDFLEGRVDWRKFTPPEWLPADEKAIRELREHGICEPYEKEFQRADGTRVPVYLADAMLPGPGEQIAAFVLDITERKQRERELEAIAALSTALRSVKTLEEMLTILLKEALSLIGTDAGNIWLYDPTSGDSYNAVSVGWIKVVPMVFKRGEGIPGLVVEKAETVISREFRTDPRVTPENRERLPEGVGGACVPLRTAESVVGGIFIYVNLPREITAGELRVLSALAEIGGSSIHRMRLHEQTVKQLERMGALRAIDMAISGSIDLRLSLNIVIEQIVSQLKVDAVSVLLLKPGSGRLEFAAGQGFRTSHIESTSLRLDQDFPGQAALQKKTVHVEDLNTNVDRFTRRDLLSSEEFVSYFGVPLIAKGEVKGVMEIFHRSKLQVDKEWLNFLDSLGWQTAIAVDNALLFEGMQRSNFDMEIAYEATIEGWSKALDLRDKETEGHTQRVTDMTLKLARAMGVRDDQLIHLRRGALLHDIGKMGVPDNILLKPGPLTEEEWQVMRRHPQFAHDLLAPITYLQPAMDIPSCHHEKWDGTGYPNGLKGELIPLAARIFAVVDVWDAVTSDRPYRSAWSQEKARDYIRAHSGTHFDPLVVEMFLSNLSELQKV